MSHNILHRIGQFGQALGEAPRNVFKGATQVIQRGKENVEENVETLGKIARQETPFQQKVREFTTPAPKSAREQLLVKIPGSDRYIDPFGSVTGIKNVGKQLFKNTAKAGLNRAKVLNEGIQNADEVIKVRKAGDGTIKITRGELETSKNITDLKPGFSRSIEGSFQNPIRVFEQMGEKAKELFYRPVKIAEHNAIVWSKYYNDQFKAVTQGLNLKNSRNIMKYALSLEDDGAKILKEHNIKPPAALSEGEQVAFDYMRKQYDTLLVGLNKARDILGKPHIPRRENYITHIRDMGILRDMGYDLTSDSIETLLRNKVHRNAPSFQFAKRRKGSLDKVELDAFNVFNKYQEQAVRNIQMTPAVAKVRELSRNVIPDGAEKFTLKEAKPNAFTFIDEWTDFVAGQKTQSNLPQVVETMLNKLNRNVAFATLSGNIRSALIQPAAITNSVTEIGPKNVSVGIKALMSGRGSFAVKNSNVLLGRQFETAIQDIASSAFGKGARIKTKVGEAGLKPLQVLDQITAQATWLGAYNRAVSQLGKAGKEAFNFADDVVVKTQASAAKSDIAKIQRTTGGKLATLFQTFVINDFNRIARDVLGISGKMTKPEITKKAMTMITSATLWNILMEDVLGVPTPFPRPVKALKEEGPVEALREVGSQVPIVGGSVRFGSSPVGAVGGTIQDLVTKSQGRYTPKSFPELVGILLGVPGTNQIKKIIHGVETLEDGYRVTVKKKNGDTKRIKIRFTDTLDKLRAVLFGPYATKAASETRETKKKPR